MVDEDLMKKRDEWYQKAKGEGKLKANPTEDHKAGLNALQHPVRRSIVRKLGEGRMMYEQIKEEFQLDGSELLKEVKKIIKAGNARRIIIKHEGKTLIEAPLTIGAVSVGALTLIAPLLVAIGAIAGIITRCTLIVEKVEKKD